MAKIMTEIDRAISEALSDAEANKNGSGDWFRSRYHALCYAKGLMEKNICQ